MGPSRASENLPLAEWRALPGANETCTRHIFEREKKGRDWMECMRQRVPVERPLLFKVEEMQHWENQLGPKGFQSSDRLPVPDD